ncbi:MAG TPA: histidine kinase N-terminal 7TM domain-containing protein [Anaerolineae bacterium]|nr:histidine kinase N-terminal 7TM domain-containing protein [Anaerolineae bacterium]
MPNRTLLGFDKDKLGLIISYPGCPIISRRVGDRDNIIERLDKSIGRFLANAKLGRWLRGAEYLVMSEQEVLYSSILWVVALISIVVAIIVGRRRLAPGGWALTIYMLAMTWWSATYALHWANVYPDGFFWLDATYLGVVTAVPALFVFVLQFTHRESWLTRPLLALLIIQPMLTVILLWTDSWHGLFFAGKRSAADSTIFAGGPWFWANVIYSYSLYLFAIVLLIKSTMTSRSLFRRQAGLVLLASLIPWLVNIISLFNINPLPALDLTPIAFMLTGSLMAVSVFRYRFLDVVPVARDKLIEKMTDGVLVIDVQERVVDINPALADLLGVNISSLIGQRVEKIFPAWEQLQGVHQGYDRIGPEILLQDNPALYLNVRLIALRDHQQNEQGQLIIFRDITARKQLESDQAKLIDSLQRALGQVKTLRGLLPICANCKKIRDDQGYWQDVAVYVRDHTEAEFSHGICPDCMQELYPDFLKK